MRSIKVLLDNMLKDALFVLAKHRPKATKVCEADMLSLDGVFFCFLVFFMVGLGIGG